MSSPVTFAELSTPTSRLIRCVDAPQISTLNPGDMVICETTWDSEDYVAACAERGIHVRTGAHRYETERITSRRRRGCLPDYPEHMLGALNTPAPGESFAEPVVTASVNAFAQTWDALSAELTTDPTYEPGLDYLPADIVDYLPYPTLNPAQVEAAALAISDDSMVVVAPTGAGKTVIGETAVLKEILHRRGKAVWLVPQRSLTNELDRELDAWRSRGLNVVTLSGESRIDHQRTREADLWVATSEKFEALCRGTSMRETIGKVGTIVVDEIHLLGDPTRGPVLETLLARITRGVAPVRLVGLSATAANAADIAAWLNATLLEITWRPTRTTHQVLTIPDGPKTQTGAHRNRLSTAIVREVSEAGGSTLVFCGTKAAVRSTALALAASRGANLTGVSPDDAQAVNDVCRGAGIGLHYSDWPYKRDAERAFLGRSINVLVATSTLAAGVNTPARAVIVRDTTIGPQDMEVSMIQQMFGRAGRAGKEPEGWAYVITEASDHAVLRRRLSDGYTITSGILDHIPDHLLGEIVQGHVTSQDSAEQWWASTLAYYQGAHDMRPLHQARDLLIAAGAITMEGPAWTVTALGALTSKMMVEIADTARLLAAFKNTPAPSGPASAEDAVFTALSLSVSAFANAPTVTKDQAQGVTQILAAKGNLGDIRSGRSGAGAGEVEGTMVVRAGLMAVARSPQAFTARSGKIAGVNRAAFNPALFDAPRYLGWLAAIAPLGVTPSWANVAAADLAQRVTHYRLLPPRGSGRLLRAAARLAGGPDSPQMPQVWAQIARAGARCPQDLVGAAVGPLVSVVDGPQGATVAPASAAAFTAPSAGDTEWPAAAGGGGCQGVVAAFGAHGDWDANGTLRAFCAI